jgi:phage recombination protein Bet
MSTATATKEQQKPKMSVSGNGPLTPAPAISQAMVAKEIEYVPLGAGSSIKLSIAAIRLILNPKTKSGRLASDEDVLKFMMLCKARQLDPYEGDAYMVGYEGQDGDQFSLITSIYAFLKRAEINPHYEGIESGVIVQVGEGGPIEEHHGDFLLAHEFLLGGWAIVHRSDRKYPKKTRVEFLKYSTGKSRWKADPGGMISKVAEMQALRDTFPTTLGGLYIEEEMPESPTTIQIKTPPSIPNQSTAQRIRNGIPKAEAQAPVPEDTKQVDESPAESNPPESPALADGEVPNEPSAPTGSDREQLELQDCRLFVAEELRRTGLDWGKKYQKILNNTPLENASLAQMKYALDEMAAKPDAKK